MIEFTVVDVKDNEDGSAIMQVDMDYETLVLFAKIGIKKVLEDEANRVLGEDSDGR